MYRQGTVVYFTKEDYEKAYLAAYEREHAGEVTEAAGVRRQSLTPFEIELIGIMGEMAAAFYYEVEPDLSVRNRRRSDKPDIVVLGRTANVKGTHIAREHRPHLLVRSYDTSQDVYIAVSVNIAERFCDMLGYVQRKKLLTYEAKPFKDPELICRAIPLEELRECIPAIPEGHAPAEIELDPNDLTLIDELTDGKT